jgi:hypothetical protein
MDGYLSSHRFGKKYLERNIVDIAVSLTLEIKKATIFIGQQKHWIKEKKWIQK